MLEFASAKEQAMRGSFRSRGKCTEHGFIFKLNLEEGISIALISKNPLRLFTGTERKCEQNALHRQDVKCLSPNGKINELKNVDSKLSVLFGWAAATHNMENI